MVYEVRQMHISQEAMLDDSPPTVVFFFGKKRLTIVKFYHTGSIIHEVDNYVNCLLQCTNRLCYGINRHSIRKLATTQSN